jgi:hypothetical protein
VRTLLLLVVLVSTGCGYLLVGTGALIYKGVQEEIDDNERAAAAKEPHYEVDVHGRRALLVARRRCPEDRSYKLLCITSDDCYFESNELRLFRCDTGECKTTPPELVRWCRGD